MTKPLIQQLAERAGFTKKHIAGWLSIADIPTMLFFELCRYLDEKAAESNPAEARGHAPELRCECGHAAANHHGGASHCQVWAGGKRCKCSWVRAVSVPDDTGVISKPSTAPEVAEPRRGYNVGVKELVACERQRDQARAELAREREQANQWLADKRDAERERDEAREELSRAKAKAERAATRHERCVEASDAAHYELAKVTGERDELKAALRREQDLHTAAAFECNSLACKWVTVEEHAAVVAERDDLLKCYGPAPKAQTPK